MNSIAASIRLPDIGKLDELELRKVLGSGDLTFEHQVTKSDDHGELATATAIVVVSLAALRVLATYLAKKNDRHDFRQEIEIVNKDGSRRKAVVAYSAASSQAPDAAVLKELGAACDVDVSRFIG